VVEDIRHALAEGRVLVPSTGAVVAGGSVQLPFTVVDNYGAELEPVSAYLTDVMLGMPAR
jgi:hypothetical protein